MAKTKSNWTVAVHLKEQSQAIVHDDVTNAYTKGPFYCVYQESINRVAKYPVADIFRVLEAYS